MTLDTRTDQDIYLTANTVNRVNPEWEFISSKDLIIQDNDMIKVIPKRKQSLLYYFITTPIILPIIISIVAITFPPNSVKRYRLIGLSLTILFVILLFIANKIAFKVNTDVPRIGNSQNINKYGVYLNDDNVFSSDEQISCDDITITSNGISGAQQPIHWCHRSRRLFAGIKCQRRHRKWCSDRIQFIHIYMKYKLRNVA
ncbi:unnamed protein product [Oppiella nova]|uniref:Uncharacterized protein n=1 Tax=Oppiella nova TaxID=334625 RepID=A0A7R9MFH1_9ACAR|nr:unnamed protein product [Oppiella nova]CAG2176280.1 unnamed protein product [Oppiella nova]